MIFIKDVDLKDMFYLGLVRFRVLPGFHLEVKKHQQRPGKFCQSSAIKVKGVRNMNNKTGGQIRFSPSRARYWIVGTFLFMEGLFFFVLLLFLSSIIAAGIHTRGLSGNEIGLITLGVVVVLLCAIFTSYVRNASTLSISLDGDHCDIKTGSEKAVILITDIKTICFLDTLRGWKYIIIYTEHKSFCITNMMFSDTEFMNVRSNMSGWLSSIGKGALIYTDSVTEVALTRNKKLPPYIYNGIWSCVFIYSCIFVILVVVCLIIA